ncbi:MAG: prepilin-type N-terminal cleavage/methylation domain-containing protein [Planctomycetia bacterium]|nr:prepilin-type N-terminal cleavage/methylation domain-containing protein [Planctomycetia bacterium]
MTRIIRTRAKRNGVTLIELLVVATIMLTLAAVSVPSIKPMLESQMTSSAASTVATYLERARMRAILTGRPCGVTFEFFEGSWDSGFDAPSTIDPGYDYGAGSVSLVLRQVQTPPYYTGLDDSATASIDPDSDSVDADGDVVRDLLYNDPYWDYFVGDEKDASIQFNSVGPFYRINRDGRVKKPAGLNFPFVKDAPFKIVREPRPTMTAPIGLPQGAVVDLEFSGTDASSFTHGSDVTIMFAANGEVDYVVNDGERFLPSGTIYFLVGRWDRISALGLTDDFNETVAEDGLWNFEDGSNFWVAINPKSGMTTTVPVNQPLNFGTTTSGRINFDDAIDESREFARFSTRNLGGR